MYSNKIDLDKFYTKESVALECIEDIELKKYDLIIEPSAGEGSFYNNIKGNKIGLDLLPEAKGITKQDWFLYNIDEKYKNVLIIGNPPFGKRNKLSIKFLEHAMSFSSVSTVGFILPNVFNKYTLQNKINKDFRISKIRELEPNSFTLNGDSYHVPCSFFIFERNQGQCLRFDPNIYKDTNDWVFSNKKDYDFFIFGASPKKVISIPNDKNRGYYIKLKNKKNKTDIIDNFKNISWNGNSSVSGGVSWFTKPEIVKIYREIIDIKI